MSDKLLDSNNLEISLLKQKIVELEERVHLLESIRSYPKVDRNIPMGPGHFGPTKEDKERWSKTLLRKDYFLDGCPEDEKKKSLGET
jgi:hypothetical protein